MLFPGFVVAPQNEAMDIRQQRVFLRDQFQVFLPITLGVAFGAKSPLQAGAVTNEKAGSLAAAVWELLRTVSRAILSDTYRVAPARKLRIPKTSGKGTRNLSIPTVVDRTVERAIIQVIQPWLDPPRPGADAARCSPARQWHDQLRNP